MLILYYRRMSGALNGTIWTFCQHAILGAHVGYNEIIILYTNRTSHLSYSMLFLATYCKLGYEFRQVRYEILSPFPTLSNITARVLIRP